MADASESGDGETEATPSLESPASTASTPNGTTDAVNDSDAANADGTTRSAASADPAAPTPAPTSAPSASEGTAATATSTTSTAGAGGTPSSRAPKRTATRDDGTRIKRQSRLAGGGKKVKAGSDLMRTRIASLVWLVAVLAAIILAVGALLIALDANRDNAIVEFVLKTAHKIDGPFWKVFEFTEDKKGPGGKQVHDVTKEVLVNWGLAAVAYLIAGRVLDRVIRP